MFFNIVVIYTVTLYNIIYYVYLVLMNSNVINNVLKLFYEIRISNPNKTLLTGINY